MVDTKSENMFEIDYSLEGTDISCEVDNQGHLVVETQGMTIRSAEKVSEHTNINALALAMRSEAMDILKKNNIMSYDEFFDLMEQEFKEMDSYTKSVVTVDEVMSDVFLSSGREHNGSLVNYKNAWNEHVIKNYEKGLSVEQQKFFQEHGLKNADGSLMKFYHGTAYGGYDSFKEGTHFTANKKYAERYLNPFASSSIKSIRNPEDKEERVYEVYISPKKVFDTLFPECQKIFEQYVNSGCAMGISPYSNRLYADSGYPDWTEAENLMEYLMDEGYEYDLLILDEGADGGYGETVIKRGLSYVAFNGCEVKEVSDLTPNHDGKMNSKYDKERQAVTKETQENLRPLNNKKTMDTKKER